jgi:hypothetical protein
VQTYADGYNEGYAAGYAQGTEYGYWSGYEIGLNSSIGYGKGRDAYDSGYDVGHRDAGTRYDFGFRAGSSRIAPFAGQGAALDGYECGYGRGFNEGYSDRFDVGESNGKSNGAAFNGSVDMNARYDKGHEVGLSVWSALESDTGFRKAFDTVAGRIMSGCGA